MLEKIKNEKLEEYNFTTEIEVDSLVNFIHKFDLQDNITAFTFTNDYANCDLKYGDCVITISAQKGLRYNHKVMFSIN